MARNIKLTSGSILAGNPVTFSIEPEILSKKPSFHRVIIEVKCALNSDTSYDTVKMTAPVAIEGNKVEFDISSAIRVPFDSYEYAPNPITYPYCKWQVRVYDEYMESNGEVYTEQGELYYPDKATFLRSIAGAFSDLDRILVNEYKDVTTLSRKPTSVPHLACVGETFAYTPAYDTPQSLLGSKEFVPPTSQEVTIATEGFQSIGGQSLYVLPQSEGDNRQVFRFINSFGVLESISVPRVYSKKLDISSTRYNVARQETFSKFSRSAVKKANNRETWLFSSDPLTEDWLHWYIHEFQMSEHVWLQIGETWIPCTIIPEEDFTFIENGNGNMLSIAFAVQLDINGSPLS